MAKKTEFDKDRIEVISEKRYLVEQCFGMVHIYYDAYRAWFTMIFKNL